MSVQIHVAPVFAHRGIQEKFRQIIYVVVSCQGVQAQRCRAHQDAATHQPMTTTTPSEVRALHTPLHSGSQAERMGFLRCRVLPADPHMGVDLHQTMKIRRISRDLLLRPTSVGPQWQGLQAILCGSYGAGRSRSRSWPPVSLTLQV